MLMTEAQGKALLAEARLPVQQSIEIANPAELAKGLPFAFPVIAKAQVRAGGRGKAGGIRKCESQAELEAAFHAIMEMSFSGERPGSILVEPFLQIARELYLAVTIDGKADGYSVMYSPNGGVEVESGPPPTTYKVGLPRRFRAHQLRQCLEAVEPDAKVREKVVGLARRLLQLASARDCITVEINPLVVQRDGSLVAADAKVVLDEAASFRSALITQAIAEERASASPAVKRCADGNLMLVWLDGEIGLISGGAGMTMAAMDAVDAAGSTPACFLDVSGNPTPAGFSLAFDLLDGSADVKGILISMFGGGLHTDRVARTLVDILKARTSTKPVTIRLNGTRSDLATTILGDAGFANHLSLEVAVQEIVEKVRAAA